MRIRVLYDQGSTLIPEDTMIFQPPCYYGAIDGISGVYLPQEGARLFDGRTGGQLVGHTISRTFKNASPGDSVEDILKEANRMVREISEMHGLSIRESGFLPSAAFVIASVGNQNITIIQGADSLAVWQMKDGTIGGTPNRTFAYEKGLLDIIAELMKKHKGDRRKLWEDFRPVLIKKRRAYVNTSQGGFCLLNGQPEAEQFWQEFTFPTEAVKILILFSDGFVPFEWTQNEKPMGERVLSLYRAGGLNLVLKTTRVIAEKKKSSSHEDYAEATAVAIEF